MCNSIKIAEVWKIPEPHKNYSGQAFKILKPLPFGFLPKYQCMTVRQNLDLIALSSSKFNPKDAEKTSTFDDFSFFGMNFEDEGANLHLF